MTDRHAAYVVVLADDVREDDAQQIINALSMVSGVKTVAPVLASYDQIIARVRRDEEWRHALQRLLREGPSGE